MLLMSSLGVDQSCRQGASLSGNEIFPLFFTVLHCDLSTAAAAAAAVTGYSDEDSGDGELRDIARIRVFIIIWTLICIICISFASH